MIDYDDEETKRDAWLDHEEREEQRARDERFESGPCPYTVGQRVCVAGRAGHAGPHDWPKR